MPALRVLGRRWHIGSDDLVFPALFCVLMRTIWVVILGCCFSSYLKSSSHKECNHPELVLFYLATATILISVVVLFELIILIVSMRGGIMQVEKRSSMPTIIHFRFFLYILETGLCVFGTYWCFVELGCTKDVIVSVRLVVVSNWVLIGLTLIGAAGVFDPFGSDKSLNDKLWERRFKCLCCCVGGMESSQSAFEDLARIFSSQFSEIDLVASDIAVGLMLVAQQQHHIATNMERNGGQCSLDTQCELFNFQARDNRQTFQDLIYYSSYALGAYGWPVFMYIHPFTGCFNLCQECSLFGNADGGLCDSNHTALKKLSGLEDNDIIYTNFTSNIYSPAFYVAVDQNKQVIIITIRGTLSLHDVITDMVCDPELIPGYEGMYAHRGMVLSATNILSVLQTDNVIERSLNRYPGFSIVVLGHSLGAGTATLLSFMLREQHPSLTCFAFGPPGGLLSENAVIESRKFVVSTVVNKEFATRLSLNSISQLKDSVLRAIQTNHRPKWKLTIDHLLSVIRIRKLSDVVLNDEEEAPLLVPSFSHATQEDGLERVDLYPPGNIVFIRRVEKQPGCCTSYSAGNFEVVWAPNTMFDNIPVTPDLLSDHLPNTLVELLKDIQPLSLSETEL